jgi:hypothetical protein
LEKGGEDEADVSMVADGGDAAPALVRALGGEETAKLGGALADLVEVRTGVDAGAGLATDAAIDGGGEGAREGDAKEVEGGRLGRWRQATWPNPLVFFPCDRILKSM